MKFPSKDITKISSAPEKCDGVNVVYQFRCTGCDFMVAHNFVTTETVPKMLRETVKQHQNDGWKCKKISIVISDVYAFPIK